VVVAEIDGASSSGGARGHDDDDRGHGGGACSRRQGRMSLRWWRGTVSCSDRTHRGGGMGKTTKDGREHQGTGRSSSAPQIGAVVYPRLDHIKGRRSLNQIWIVQRDCGRDDAQLGCREAKTECKRRGKATRKLRRWRSSVHAEHRWGRRRDCGRRDRRSQ
jgi:hypothetical protein